MLYGNEGNRYGKIENFRVDAVSEAYFLRSNPLYRPRPPWKVDPGFAYSSSSIPKGKFASIDEALAAVREALKPGASPYEAKVTETVVPPKGYRIEGGKFYYVR